MGPSLIGITSFVVVKFAGYTYAGKVLKKAYQKESPKVLTFGVARTVLGIAVGIPYAYLASQVGIFNSSFMFLLLLLPVRFCEWLFILWVFFERGSVQPRRWFKNSFYGSGWSYVLDIPAIASVFVVPGGLWVC